MKTKLNIALEGTYNGDVIGGLLLWAGENLQALSYLGKGALWLALQKDVTGMS